MVPRFNTVDIRASITGLAQNVSEDQSDFDIHLLGRAISEFGHQLPVTQHISVASTLVRLPFRSPPTVKLTAMPSKLRIAMLNTDTPVPTDRPRWITCGKMFEDLLVAAASRVAPNTAIESTEYNVQQFQYPSCLADVDVILVTGSAADEWIRHLNNYVLDAYTNHRHVRMFGICFAHQFICQNLLREHGVRVEKDPNGYELGVKEIRLEERFRKTLGNGRASSRQIPEALRVQLIHADHVVIPALESLPDSWMILRATQHCAVQGAYEPARVFTPQGHFEFNRFVNTEIVTSSQVTCG